MKQSDPQTQPLLRRGCTGAFVNQAGERINLRVSTSVNSIHNIDSANNCFDCDFTLALSWDDPKVAKDDTKVKGTYITLGPDSVDYNYRPDVFIVNDVTSDNDKNLVAEEIYVTNSERGTVVNTRRMRGTFTTNFMYHSFPFDMHTLKVQFYFHPCYDLKGPIESIKTNWWGDHVNNEFDMDGVVHEEFEHKVSPDSGITFETYAFEVKVIRKYSSYLVNIGALVEGMFALGLAVLMLETDELNDRINLTLVIVLAYSAFKMMVAGMVPALGYMTILDRWIMWGFWLNCGAGLLSMATVYLELDDKMANQMNWFYGLSSLLAWAAMHARLIYHFGFFTRRKFIKDMKKD